MALFQFAGFCSTGDADLRDEMGSGSTPRNGAGSIATEATARPRPAMICVSKPPNEWPTTAGFLLSAWMTESMWSATWPTFLPAKTSGWAFASETVSGSSGHPGFTAVKPASSNKAAHRFQLLGSSQQPWMKTTGVRPDAVAGATCSNSWSVMPAGLAAVVLTCSSRALLRPHPASATAIVPAFRTSCEEGGGVRPGDL